jgi:hypothetical protein
VNLYLPLLLLAQDFDFQEMVLIVNPDLKESM